MNPIHMSAYTNKPSAYLEIILGCMFSGKTSRLVEVYKQCNFCNIPVNVINHISDNRYDEEMLSTHDLVKIPCVKTDRLMALEDIISGDVILINEGQFFPDLKDFVSLMLGQGKKIYVCGLDGDFERKKFGQILDLIPICDKVIKLTSLCTLCKDGTQGIFSKRISGETGQLVIGTKNYIPVCRNCYEK